MPSGSSHRLTRLTSFLSLTFFMVVTAGFPLTVVLHEAGHVAGAFLAGGFEILSIMVFPLTWERKPQGWIVSRSWKRWWAEAGRVVLQPTSMPGLRRRALLFMAGGPIASLLSCLVFAAAVAAIIRWGLDGELSGQVLLLLCAAQVLMHGVTALLTLYPARKLPGGTLPTDGWNILTLARGNAFTMSQWASRVVVRTLRAGRPLAEALDRESLERWARREPANGYLHFLLLIAALDRKDLDAARALVVAALNAQPAKNPATQIDRTHDFLTHFIVLAALTEHNPDAAHGALTRLKATKGVEVRPHLAIARAAVAAAKKESEIVRRELTELDALLAKSPFPAAMTSAYHWAREIIETNMPRGM